MDSMSASSSAGHPNISTGQFPNTTSLPVDSRPANNYLAKMLYIMPSSVVLACPLSAKSRHSQVIRRSLIFAATHRIHGKATPVGAGYRYG